MSNESLTAFARRRWRRRIEDMDVNELRSALTDMDHHVHDCAEAGVSVRDVETRARAGIRGRLRALGADPGP